MKNAKKVAFIPAFIVTILSFSGSIFSQAYHNPNPTDSLAARWEWAKQESSKHGLKDGFWIGYSIKRLMREHAYIYSTDKQTITGSHITGFPKGEPLEKILAEKTAAPISDQEQVRREAKRALDRLENPGESDKKAWKEVAVLCRFGRMPSGVPVTIRVSSLDLPFDPEGLPLFWLGQAKDTQSLSVLDNIYALSREEKLKKRILTVVGFHRTSDAAVDFLEKVLDGREPESLRARAALELGDQDHERAVRLLHHAANQDPSFEVRKRSVYGLEDIELPSAADALIDIAQNGKDKEIRKRAVDCLADIASQKAAAALRNVVDNDGDTDIQKRALYALEDLPDDEGVPYIVDIAKTHDKLAIRKAAIYCLGDSDDPRALQALIEIIKQ